MSVQQPLSRRRGRPRPWALSLAILTGLYFVSLSIPVADGQTSCAADLQPAIASVDPPSGSRVTVFTILGDNLDQISDFMVTQGGVELQVTDNVTESGITFMVTGTPDVDGLVTILLVPTADSCVNVSVEIFLLRIPIFASLGPGMQTVQPGTVLATTIACLPPLCGDNSTDYEVTLNGQVLQDFSDSATSFIVRFPTTSMAYLNVELFIQTFYSLIGSSVFVDFVESPNITSITPNTGQSGTRVIIEGDNLLGFGGGTITLKEVLVGSSLATIDRIQSDQTRIFARVNSGRPNSTSIRVNTTQTLGGGSYDGPYTYSDTLWTQLEDGVVTEIVPPAVQIGGVLRLCGERLLGGGSRIVGITIAEQNVDSFSSIEPNTDSNSSSECIEAVVPTVAGPENTVSGGIAIEADTGATILSSPDVTFTYAVITDVQPNEGQVGTEVRITGVELLSGYRNLEPTVYLSGVQATVLSSGVGSILVRVEEPDNISESGSGSGDISLSGIFDTPGDVVIVVVATDSRDYNLSLSDSWTYRVAGGIEKVEPTYGQFGTRITLTGTNLLGYGTDIRQALVGNATAMVVSRSSSVVMLTAPDGQFGLVDIVLESNNGALVSMDDAFEYGERGVITRLDPVSGQNGTFVTIFGTNLLGHAENIFRIEFGNFEADVDYDSINDSQICVRVQANDVTANTAVQVVITAITMARVTSSGDDWTYLVPGRVGVVQPNIGQFGTIVTITGTSLLGGGSAVQTILLDGVNGTVISASATAITVAMDDISRQIDFYRGVVYIVADTGAVVTGGAYTHQVSGEITAISPEMGREGTRVSITGNNLYGYGTRIDEVSIAGVEGVITEQIDGSTIVIRIGAAPGGTAGLVTLTSDTEAVVSSASNLTFTYIEPGTIAAVSPAEGTEGSGVLVEGDSLRPPGTFVSMVTIGGSPVSRIVTESDTEIAVVVGPAPVNGGVNITVVITADDGSIVRGGNFTYLDLNISLTNRNQGQQGTQVQIAVPDDDEAFLPSLSLVTTFGGRTAATTSFSEVGRSIEVTVPRAGEVGSYTVDVTVEGTDGRVARLRNGFTYVEEGVIFSATPNRGQRGTEIQVLGRNLLGGGTEISSARVGERGVREVTATVMDSNEERVDLVISENLPAGSPLPLVGDITLIADTGATIIAVGIFTLVQPGHISSVTPVRGQFGTIVTIIGTNLLQGGTVEDVSSITLAGREVYAVLDTPTPPTDERITVQANASSESGPGQVIITLTTGARIISPNSITFQYLPPGVINTTTPDVGTVGTRVVISGENLLGGGQVDEIYLGGTRADIETTPGPTDSEILVTARQPVSNGSGIVEIRIDTGAVISGGFWEYEELGVVTAISPSVGQQGVTVTISGVSLLGSSADEFVTCSLAGVPGTVNRSLDDEAMCRAGFNPGAGMTSDPSQLSGPVVLVADSGPVIISDDDFSYYVAYIEEIEPTNGTNGTFVTITGRNLIGSNESDEFNVTSVTFGAVSAFSAAEVISRDSVRVRVGYSQSPTANNSVRLELTSGAFLELQDAWMYTEPGEIESVSPETAQPGEEVYISGTNLVPPCVSEVVVIVGQTRSYVAAVVNSTGDLSQVVFRPGPYQDGFDANLDDPGEFVPIQVIASNGATVYSNSVLFRYNVSTARVTMVTPTAGSGGTEVTITGTNLLSGGTPAVNVTLAGQDTVIVTATDTEVVVRAGDGPEDGTSGRVIIESDNGLVSGIGTNVWQYLPVVTASDVTPQFGQQGTRVSIDLRGILLTVSAVFLNNERAVTVSGTAIMVEANPSPATGVGDIRVEFSGGAELIIPDSWRYLQPTTVTSLMPDLGYFNTVVRITGSNFQAGGRRVETVELAGLATEIVAQDNSELVVRISEYQNSSSGAVEGPVTIVSEDGATYVSIGGVEFTYVQLRVDSVTPQSGQGGTVVTIVGEGLLAGASPDQPLSSAQLGGVEVQEVMSHSDTRIQLVSSSFPSATSDDNITYTVSSEGQVVIPNSWSYLQPGVVTEVTPLAGGQGSYVTLRGENMLQGGSGVREVRVAGVMVLEVVVALDNLIQVRLGRTTNLPQGPVVIVSDTGAQLQSTVSFRYTQTGTISNVDPNFGQNGTRVMIRGSRFRDFGDVVRVSLAGVEATVEEDTDTSLTVVAGRPDVFEEFSEEVVIETSSGVIITGDENFMYRQEGVICSVSPPQGQVGTRVVISGDRLFGGGASLDTVYLAGVRADINTVNSSDSVVTVTASASATAPITGDIILIANTGAYVRRINGWSYVMPGSVSSVQPQQGQYGTRITITGMGLLSGGDRVTQITIGNVVTNDITSSTDSRVEARAGAPDPGMTAGFTDTISLISNYGGALPSTFTWTYLQSSEVTNVSQMSGRGNDVVIIDGVRLFGGGSAIVTVTTAGESASNVMATDTRVEFTVGSHPNGAAVTGDIIIEADTGALTIIENGWTYERACPVGQYGTFDNCTNCSEECASCNGPTNEDCFVCNNSGFMIELDSDSMRCVNQCPNVSTLADVCVDACESNQYSRTNTTREATFCYDCSTLCDADLGCAGPDPTECTSCEIARDGDSRECVASCPLGTWLNETRVCLPCHSQCNASAGCFGESNADCYSCRSVRISSQYLDDLGSASAFQDTIAADFCIESCPSAYYEDEDGDCFPCHEECRDGCTGPNAFDCRMCASVSRPQDGASVCVSTCNAGKSVSTLYPSSNGTCQQCSSRCSRRDGCTGPTAAECITCAVSPNNVSLPRFGGVCVSTCPNTTSSETPRPERFYYHNMATGDCELCDVSCEDGCSGPTARDCTSTSDDASSGAFSAGPGTIGITVSIIVVLALISVVVIILFAMWVRWQRHGGYKLRDGEVGGLEMEQRYSRGPNNQTTTTTKVSGKDGKNDALDENYTLMAPSASVAGTLKERSASPQHGPIVHVPEMQYKEVRASMIADTSLAIGNEDADLYSEAGPEIPMVPERPAKPAPFQDKAKPAGKGRKVSGDQSSKPPPLTAQQTNKTPVRVPALTQQTSSSKLEKPAKKPALPPPSDPEPEMYTEMAVGVQQVYLPPTTGPEEEYSEMAPPTTGPDEEYSEMAPIHQAEGTSEETYEDTTTLSPQKTANEKTPLIDDLYEDTDMTVQSSDYQKMKYSASSVAVGAPSIPKQPIPRKRMSQPLPQTPLELSIQNRPPQPTADALYESTEPQAVPEESLYEAVPAQGRLLPAEPSPNLPPKGAKNTVPLPPRVKK